MAALVRHNAARATTFSSATEVARCFDTADQISEIKAANNRFPAPDYMHHVPGRLRLKAAEFRNKPSLLEAARRELMALRGVSSVSTNPLTGSILVEYDPLVSAPAALSEAIQERGFPHVHLEAPALTSRGQTSLTEHLAGMAVWTLFDWLFEHLVISAVAAVI
jgi:hypothetical protein